MNTMKRGVDPFQGWSKDEIRALISFMIDFDKKLKATGELVSAEGFGFPRASQAGARRQGWRTDYRRHISRKQGVSRWLLDR
ncbi:MAG TPA: hypothetical protein VMD98_13455 [Bryocella sp.]|nr:hypothetical protein [Bryocella sp.]